MIIRLISTKCIPLANSTVYHLNLVRHGIKSLFHIPVLGYLSRILYSRKRRKSFRFQRSAVSHPTVSKITSLHVSREEVSIFYRGRSAGSLGEMQFVHYQLVLNLSLVYQSSSDLSKFSHLVFLLLIYR